MAGWGISIGCGAVAGLIIGFIYRLLNDSFNQPVDFFNDGTLYEYPKIDGGQGEAQEDAVGEVPESRKAL